AMTASQGDLMRSFRLSRLLLAAVVLPLLVLVVNCPNSFGSPRLEDIQLPPGFKIEFYARDVPNARSMVLSPSGTVFVGTRTRGTVDARPDANGDRKADRVVVIDRGLDKPNGVAFREGSLYVAEATRILRYDDIEARLDNPPQPVVVNDDIYPAQNSHDWKYIAFGPDDKLYVPVGAPCNVCNPSEPIYSTITRMNPDGTGFEIFAHGIRNTVGFDWHPETGELWFTDNGRDWMGDNIPPDELNRPPEPGLHVGCPFCHGGGLPDDRLGGRGCDEFVAPEIKRDPLVPAVGREFFPGDMSPEGHRRDIFIGEHGSWNRRTPIGYRVMRVKM